MNKGKIIGRIIFDLVIALSVLNGWWFIAAPVALGAAWIFPYYAEIIIAAVVYDALFGMVREMGWIGYIATMLSVVVLAATAGLKRVVRK
jgi:hypothetical protein